MWTVCVWDKLCLKTWCVEDNPRSLLFQTESEKKLQERLTKLMTILSGDMTIDLHLQFLIRNNKTDLLVLKNTKV